METEEFLEKLRRGEFERHLVFDGMVEEHDEMEDAIRFALGTSCRRWISIPVERIESIDLLRVVPCDDHTHPFVRLELKQPETDEGTVFADLLDLSRASWHGRRAPAMRRRFHRGPLSRLGIDGPGEIEPVPPAPYPPECLLQCVKAYTDCLRAGIPVEICADLFVSCSETCAPIPA